MKSNFLSHKSKGFTLIELLIVIGILAVLGGIAYPTYMSIAADGQKKAAEQVCLNIVQGVTLYSQDNNGALPYDVSMVQPDDNDQIILETAEGKDARLIQVLTNREVDDDNRLNNSRDTYLAIEEKDDSAKRDGLYVDSASGDVNLYDAWGKPYYVILCEEQEGCIDPFHPERKRYRGKQCFVYSTGPDMEGSAADLGFSTAKSDAKGKKGKKDKKKKSKKDKKEAAAAASEALEEALEDNVYSWKKS